MSREFIRKATEYVRQKEQADLESMADRAIKANHRAEGCGCHQCRKAATASRDAFVAESHRVNTGGPDHEEDDLMNWAINNRLLKSGKD